MHFTRRKAIGAAALTMAAWSRGAFAKNNGGVDAVLQKYVDSGELAGIVAMSASDEGISYKNAFGKRTIGSPQAMTLDSVFWVASMTKAVTTVAAMQLVEQGKLSLHEPVGIILPELAKPKVLEGFAVDGKPQLRDAKRPITLHHLLTHTSGFTYSIWNANNARYEKDMGLPNVATSKFASLLTPLAFDPGDQWEYGTSVDWAGQMIERVSGQSLESYFHEHIFAPIGMNDTSFILNDDQRRRLVGMHSRQANGALTAIDFLMPQKPEFFTGGGGLYSTAPDYMKFLQIFLHDGRANGTLILRPESVKAMTRNQIGDLRVHMLKTSNAFLSNDAEFFPGTPKSWSYGFMVNDRETPTGRSAGSLAWAGLANTYYWIDLKRKRSGVIMMQLLPFADGPALKAFSEFETATI